MSRFSLPIYGDGDELLKTYEADRIRWGTLVEAAGIKEGLEGKGLKEQVEEVGRFLTSVFPGLTEEDLRKADYLDVLNTFNQLLAGLGGMKADQAKN